MDLLDVKRTVIFQIRIMACEWLFKPVHTFLLRGLNPPADGAIAPLVTLGLCIMWFSPLEFTCLCWWTFVLHFHGSFLASNSVSDLPSSRVRDAAISPPKPPLNLCSLPGQAHSSPFDFLCFLCTCNILLGKYTSLKLNKRVNKSALSIQQLRMV